MTTARLHYHSEQHRDLEVDPSKLTFYVRHNGVVFEFSHSSPPDGSNLREHRVQHYREHRPQRVTEIP